MEATEPQASPVSSPPLRGIKKVFSKQSQASTLDPNSDVSSLRGGLRSSADSQVEKSPSRQSQGSSRDGSSKSGSSGIRKLLPGHARRQRRRKRAAEMADGAEGVERGRLHSDTPATSSMPNQSLTSLSHDGDSSLLTDDSEPEAHPTQQKSTYSRSNRATILRLPLAIMGLVVVSTIYPLHKSFNPVALPSSQDADADVVSFANSAPPLISRDSHAGFLTTSSPLITKNTVDESPTKRHMPDLVQIRTDSAVPVVVSEPDGFQPITSPAFPVSESTPVLSTSPIDRVDSLTAPSEERAGRRKSIASSFRNLSPARRLKDKFAPTKSDRSPRSSPERSPVASFSGNTAGMLADVPNIGERRQAKRPENPPPLPADINTASQDRFQTANVSLNSLDTSKPPRTPPNSGPTAPLTTVTPPTPTEASSITPRGSPRRETEPSNSSNDTSDIIISPSGNMISHRRSRSGSSLIHQPSKLSNSILAPLTPTIEEVKTPSTRGSDSRNVTPGGGFFSSWVSAAQNAANTLSSTLNTQSRSRSGTSNSEPEKPQESPERAESKASEVEPESPRKQLAIETLGAGDLDFSHLGIDIGGSAEERPLPPLRPDLEDLRKNSTVKRDEASAKIEDMLAKRAVSVAYENAGSTPVAEVPDPMNAVKHSSTFNTTLSGEQTPPNGSIFESEAGSIKRSNSVRSRMQQRRSRGSSGATGSSAIAAMIGASTATLANPASGPRLTGFAVAPKQRNRTFHQLFRSVPDDDYLIEDYSCALQRDILLAGRIYISEGHICFSSNILGWVTTLVISFEEVVSVERETTAMVFPNAIAIQTLHARHTFRSLLSREATFDLLIGIWKVSHPAAFQKSINGKQALQEARDKTEKVVESENESEAVSEDDDEVYDEDEDEDGAGSFLGSNGSIQGSDVGDVRENTRKASAMNGVAVAAASAQPIVVSDIAPGEKSASAAAEASTDFPGPATHAPTDCSDSSTHYDKIVKDEIIPAPLGKIYSMLYGPASGVFITKYLNEECKVMDLVFEDDKKGLSNDIKSRQYTYIKPLGGSIGPKQTKCITTENMDLFDLDKSVSVTCTTQTPDVPSGNVFSTKTRYCLSWAPGNATRLQMNCTIEWTGKSWLKGPIEKGANDGQQTYGNDLVRALRAAVSRPRAATTTSKGTKGGKKRRRGEKSTVTATTQDVKKQEEDWGMFELLRGPLGPVVGVFKPLANSTVLITIIVVLLSIMWFRGPSRGPAGGVGYPSHSGSERIAAYEELWHKEESELWDWLEERVGVEGLGLKERSSKSRAKDEKKEAKIKLEQRQKILGGKDVEAKLKEEKMSVREMEDAIRVTQERLHVLKDVVERRKKKQGIRASEHSAEGS